MDAGPPSPVRVGDWARYTFEYELERGEDRAWLALVARLQVVSRDATSRQVLITFEPTGALGVPPTFQRPLLLRLGPSTRASHEGATPRWCEGAGRRWPCSCWSHLARPGYEGPHDLGCVSSAGELAAGSGVVGLESTAGIRFRRYATRKVSLDSVGHDEPLPPLPDTVEPHEGNRALEQTSGEQGVGLEERTWATGAAGLERTTVRFRQAPTGLDGGGLEVDGRAFVPGPPAVGSWDAISYVELLVEGWLESPWPAEGVAGQLELDGNVVKTVTVTRGRYTETFAADPWALPAMREVQFSPLRRVEGDHVDQVRSAK